MKQSGKQATEQQPRPTRRQRVIEILDAAAAGSDVDYDGAGRFWHRATEELLNYRLRGVLMVGPEQARESCCGGTAGRRSEASGLIKGLRGEAPFDGSKFPRLPWGGEAVAERDIEFIAAWIDDGCPDDTVLQSSEVAELTAASASVEPVAEVESDVPVVRFEPTAGSYQADPDELRQRVNVDCMSEEELGQLREAMRRLYDLNKWPEDRRNYNNVALIHQNHCQHGWERFLPWHRVYLYELEQALQDQVPGVTMPYWDWTMAHYVPEKPESGSIIPPAFKCFLTERSLVFLSQADPPLGREQIQALRAGGMVGQLFVSQRAFFARVGQLIGEQYTEGEHRNRFIDALLASNSLWYPLRYPAEYNIDGTPGTINTVIHYHYPSGRDTDQIMSLDNFRDFGGGSLYNDSFGFLDQNPHNTMHIWTGGMNPDYSSQASESELAQRVPDGVQVAGRQFHTREDMYSKPQYGDMFSNLTASYDPIFWPIHVNVDRLWAQWQLAHRHAEPVDLDAVLTPWSYTVRDTLDINSFGYEYVKSRHSVHIGYEVPVGRFVTGEFAISDSVRAGFRRAELRLHRIPQLPRSCFIRVFLNLDDANASTPLEHASYAGYLAIFGHGPCYGGPGHCAIPPTRGRRFDRRPRSHNTPRNHRIDVSACARRMFDAGATSLRVTLVVLGANYREDGELLKLQGLSLNFMD